MKLKPVDAGSNTAAGTHTDQKPELSSLRKWCAAAEWWPAAEFWRPAGRDRVSSVRARPELVLAVGWRAAAAPRHAEPWRLRDHQVRMRYSIWRGLVQSVHGADLLVREGSSAKFTCTVRWGSEA